MSEKLNIAVVCGTNNTNRLFTSHALDKLRALGNLVVNDEAAEPTPERLVKLGSDADVIVTSWGTPQLSKEIMEKLPKLKYVAHAAGSVKPVVSDAMFDQGVRVTSSAKVLGIGVAETALGYTLACVKNLFNVSRSIAAGGWTPESPLKEYDDIREMFEIKIGVISAGNVGGHFMKLLSMFDVEILLYEPFITAEQAMERYGAKLCTLEEVLTQSDVVSIHAPSIPATNHMFNAETLKLMKKDASLINTARGSIVDEQALYEHMKAGNLKYACLDVFDPYEPPLADNPLRTLPNCIMSPHLAGLTHNGLLRIGAHCAAEIERFAAGLPLTTEVSQSQLSTSA